MFQQRLVSCTFVLGRKGPLDAGQYCCCSSTGSRQKLTLHTWNVAVSLSPFEGKPQYGRGNGTVAVGTIWQILVSWGCATGWHDVLNASQELEWGAGVPPWGGGSLSRCGSPNYCLLLVHQPYLLPTPRVHFLIHSVSATDLVILYAAVLTELKLLCTYMLRGAFTSLPYSSESSPFWFCCGQECNCKEYGVMQSSPAKLRERLKIPKREPAGVVGEGGKEDRSHTETI